MNELDLTESVDAAGAAMLYALHPSLTGTWDEVPPFYKHEWRERALPAITAAAPLIAAQVREQERQRFSAILDGFDEFGAALAAIPGVVGPIGKSLRVAVLVARGGAS